MFEPSQNYDVETFNIQISDVNVFDQISFPHFKGNSQGNSGSSSDNLSKDSDEKAIEKLPIHDSKDIGKY